MLTALKHTPWCLFNVTFIFFFKSKYHLSSTHQKHSWTNVSQKCLWKIWQNRFAYPKHVTYLTHCQMAVFTCEHPTFFLNLPHLIHWITTLTIFRSLLPGINQCLRHMFVPFSVFHLSICLSRSHILLITVSNNDLVHCTVIWHCLFDYI